MFKFFIKGVGKSSILIRFVSNEFKPILKSTLGAAFMSKTIFYKEQAIKFEVNRLKKTSFKRKAQRYGTLLDKRNTML